jgi:hypothetical protein
VCEAADSVKRKRCALSAGVSGTGLTTACARCSAVGHCCVVVVAVVGRCGPCSRAWPCSACVGAGIAVVSGKLGSDGRAEARSLFTYSTSSSLGGVLVCFVVVAAGGVLAAGAYEAHAVAGLPALLLEAATCTFLCASLLAPGTFLCPAPPPEGTCAWEGTFLFPSGLRFFIGVVIAHPWTLSWTSTVFPLYAMTTPWLTY